MDSKEKKTDQDISIALPLKISFSAVEKFLEKQLVGKTISKKDAHNIELKYFKILDLKITNSNDALYNLELTLNLQTLTRLYHNKEIQFSVLTNLKLDAAAQQLYIEAYKTSSKGGSWIINNLTTSLINTFIYRHLLKKLNIDLRPLVKQKLISINNKLASKLETSKGISILGEIHSFTIDHLEVKADELWLIINSMGWCVIDIDDLDF